MKKIILFLFTLIFLTGCIKLYDYVRLIRFFDGENVNDKIVYYKILDNQMFFETTLLGTVKNIDTIKIVVLNENNQQVDQYSFNNKILKIYKYDEPKDEFPSMVVDIISSHNGICKDFNAGLPINRKTTLNIYQPNRYNIRFVTRNSYTLSNDISKKFSGNYFQLGFHVLGESQVDKAQKISINSFRELLKNKCKNFDGN